MLPLRLQDVLSLLALALGLSIYVAFAITPSHFAVTLQTLGFEKTGLLLWKARNIRSDDFFVATALIRNVVENGFSPIDAVSPYGESFKSFVASPIHDWAMVFRPQFWGFLVLPPANALSLYFGLLGASFLLGWTLVLRRLGVDPLLAVLLVLCLLFSHIVQVWWTQRAPVVALAPWPMLIMMARWPWPLRLPLLAYATAVWLLGEFYPPAIIATGFAWVILLLAFDEDVRKPGAWRGHLLDLLALAVGAAVVAFYFRDIIPPLAQSIYPGQRHSEGGDVPHLMMWAHLFPHSASIGSSPAIPNSNECEVGVAATFLPLALLCFGDPAGLSRIFRTNKTSVIVLAGGLLAMLAWMMLPIPGRMVQFLLWDRVPPVRMLWGFGLLLTFGVGLVLARAGVRLTRARLALFCTLIVLNWLASKLVFSDPMDVVNFPSRTAMLARSFIDLAPVLGLCALGFLLLPRWTGLTRRGREFVTAMAVIDSVLAFGWFNPVQSAHAIFTHDRSPLLEAAATLRDANPRGWAAIPGIGGMSLNAFGVRALNHVLMVPDPAFFKKAFPEWPEAEVVTTFNRYAHVHPVFAATLSNPQADVARVPLFDVGTPLPVAPMQPNGAASERVKSIESVSIESADGANIRVVIKGWAPFRWITPDQRLQLSMRAGEMLSARAVRLPSLEVAKDKSDKAYATAGFGLEIILRGATPKPDDFELTARTETGRLVLLEPIPNLSPTP